jgi:two-component system CheB/CheR fusion protein
LGGQILVSSELHSGSTFYFTVPYIPTFDEDNSYRKGEPEPSDYKWNDRTFLIVEDDKVSFKFLENIFRKTGAKIVHADNGLKAVELIKQSPEIDMVLMDIQLPEMNGLDATRMIKQLRKELPVIAQTANVLEEDREKCLEAGCVDYISKPINIKLLYSKIHQYLTKS